MTAKEIYERVRERALPRTAWAGLTKSVPEPFFKVERGATSRRSARRLRDDDALKFQRALGPDGRGPPEGERDPGGLPPVFVRASKQQIVDQGRRRPGRGADRHGGGRLEGRQLVRAGGVRPVRSPLRGALGPAAGSCCPRTGWAIPCARISSSRKSTTASAPSASRWCRRTCADRSRTGCRDGIVGAGFEPARVRVVDEGRISWPRLPNAPACTPKT